MIIQFRELGEANFGHARSEEGMCSEQGRALRKSPVDFFSEGAGLRGEGKSYRFRRPFFGSFFGRTKKEQIEINGFGQI